MNKEDTLELGIGENTFTIKPVFIVLRNSEVVNVNTRNFLYKLLDKLEELIVEEDEK